eukprot:2061295-Amphidinium_carterae.1
MEDLLEAMALIECMQSDTDFGLVFHPHLHFCCLDLRCRSRTVSHQVQLESKADLARDLRAFGEEQPTDATERTLLPEGSSEQAQLCVSWFLMLFLLTSISSSEAGYKIRRVCQSTLMAEANALVVGAEHSDFCRQWFTDSKLLYDVVTVVVNDKRFRIVVAQLRQLDPEGDVALA